MGRPKSEGKRWQGICKIFDKGSTLILSLGLSVVILISAQMYTRRAASADQNRKGRK